MTSPLRTLLSAAVVGVVVAACADTPATPVSPLAPSAASLGTAAKPVEPKVKATGLQWKKALKAPVTQSATIGVLGGVLDVPELGFHLVVPAGAVSTPTEFSVTALAGKMVAYDFQPAGSKFLVPLLLVQDQQALAQPASPLGLQVGLELGYFAAPSDLDDAAGVANVTELRTSLGLATAQSLVFPVWHFSGYIVCWGRGSTGGYGAE